MLLKNCFFFLISKINKGAILAFIIGSFAFLLIVGISPLLPSNVSWINILDPTQQFIGWQFFRNTPWSVPIGINPNFGLDFSNSIVYTDSIPLLAFIFKIFSPLLPEKFQYLGMWYLLSLILQAYFSIKLISLISKETSIQVLGAILFVFSPPLLFRINLQSALTGHFFILAGLYLNLGTQNNKRAFQWCALILTAEMVNIYLMVMVMGLWLANLLDKSVLQKSIHLKSALLEFWAIFALVPFCAWLIGYFEVADTAIQGEYGQYGMNVLSFLTPNGWSYLLPGEKENDFALLGGFNYMGLGLIVGSLISFLLLFSNKIQIKILLSYAFFNYLFLIILFVLFSVFAISQNIHIGTWGFSLPIPEKIISIASNLRHSNRLIWPIFYITYLSIIFLIVKGIKKQLVSWILLCLVFLQTADTSKGWVLLHKTLSKSHQSPDQILKNPFWQCAGTLYSKIILAPPEISVIQPYWEIFSTFATKFNMGTNFTYFARVDSNKIASSREKLLLSLEMGTFDKNALYILKPWREQPNQKILINSQNDVLMQIDGFLVLAPNWKVKGGCRNSVNEKETLNFRPIIFTNQAIPFSNQNDNYSKFLISGWSNPEAWGIWSIGSKAQILLPLPLEKISSLEIEVSPFISSKNPKQELIISINGKLIGPFFLSKPGTNWINIPLSLEIQAAELVQIDLTFPLRTSPKKLGLYNDERELAIGLISARFVR